MAILNSTIVTGDLKVLNETKLGVTTFTDSVTGVTPTGRVFSLFNHGNGDTNFTNIDFGWNYANRDGAGAAFRSVDSTVTGEQGAFVFYSRNATNNYVLTGRCDGTLTWSGPTPAFGTNNTQIATTAYVYQNAARVLNADTTIFVAYDGTGDGTTAAKAMSINDMWKYLASVRMEDASGGISTSKTLTIKFVPRASSASYGNLSLEKTKMPGVTNLVIDTSTGVAGTTSNYTTNCPYFGNIVVRGDITATIKNIQFTGLLQASNNALVYLNTYIGGPRFESTTYSTMVFQNGVYNINNANTSYLLTAWYYGRIELNSATINFNFRELCRYTGEIFNADIYGRLYLNYARMKFTGTQPVVSLTASGTLTGTCSTAAGTAAKVLTSSAGSTTLSNGLVIYVKFSNDNTAANPTLNVDGTGAKPIYFGSTNIPTNYLNKTIQYKMTYNSTSGAWVCNNTFQRLENINNNSFLTYGSNYNTTYNSGSWNWTGFSRNWTSDVNINGTHYGGVNNYLPLSGGTVTGTLVLSKNTGLSGTAANAVALIVGGAQTAKHIEIDFNEIQAKSSGTASTDLKLNSTGGGSVYIGTSAKGVCVNSSNSIYPRTTKAISCGHSSYLWTTVYAQTATINTSDIREKQAIDDIPDEVLDAWGEVNFKQYKLNDSVNEKGFENARFHTGLIAQEIMEVFTKHGLDPTKYGLFCHDEWDVHEDPKDETSPVVEHKDAYALRYEEALCLEAAYQRRRLDRLEAIIKNLQA